MKEQILVTGAGGFIGSHLTEALLSQGRRVRALVHYNFQNNQGWLDEVITRLQDQSYEKTSLGIKYHNLIGAGSLEVVAGDIQDPFLVDALVQNCHMVYHLAALISIPYSYIAPASYIAVNIGGTFNILEACRKQGVDRVIHTSTSEVYGTAKYTPIDEAHPVQGQSPYSASKIGADHLAESYYRSFDLPVSIIRPFNTFGPRQSARAVIPTIITQALSGAEQICLGSLQPIRDFTYVADMVQGFITVAASDMTIGRVANIGRGQGVTIGELAELILKICESDAKIVTDETRIRPIKSEVFELISSYRWAIEKLGWRPHCSLRQGLEKTVEWIRKNQEHYKPAVYQL